MADAAAAFIIANNRIDQRGADQRRINHEIERQYDRLIRAVDRWKEHYA